MENELFTLEAFPESIILRLDDEINLTDLNESTFIENMFHDWVKDHKCKKHLKKLPVLPNAGELIEYNIKDFSINIKDLIKCHAKAYQVDIGEFMHYVAVWWLDKYGILKY